MINVFIFSFLALFQQAFKLANVTSFISIIFSVCLTISHFIYPLFKQDHVLIHDSYSSTSNYNTALLRQYTTQLVQDVFTKHTLGYASR